MTFGTTLDHFGTILGSSMARHSKFSSQFLDQRDVTSASNCNEYGNCLVLEVYLLGI